MTSTTPSQQSLGLQRKAIENTRSAFAKLPSGDALFQKCISDKAGVGELASALKLSCAAHDKKRLRILKQFEKSCTWLQNFSPVVDVVVQTQAGISCPVWAPLKLVLMMSAFHSAVVESVNAIIETMSDKLPRLRIYEQLNDDPVLTTSLLNVYTEIVEASVCIFQYLSKNRLKRMFRIIGSSLSKDLEHFLQRLQQAAVEADTSAAAIEMLRASEFRTEQTKKDLEDLKIKVSEWLQPSNMREVLEQNFELKLAGTCQWIWSNVPFTEWKSKTCSDPSESRLLLISGIPGCGKSILASAIAQSLQDQEQRVLFFSFSDLDSSRQTHDHLIRSFLWQMLQDSQCAKSFEVMRKLIVQNQTINSDLWTAFAEITALAPPKKMFWIIDGLDESRGPSAEFIDLIKNQLQIHKSARATLLGRPSSFSSTQSPAIVEIEPEMTVADIGSFIEAEVNKSENLKSSAVQSLALENLQASAQGMFLWVKFMINELNKPASNAVLQERLLKLPNGLKETYRRLLASLLNDMDDIDKRTTKCLLSLIVAARRPLKVEELQYAQAIAAWLDSKSTSAFTFSEYGVPRFRQQLKSLCKNLVYVSNGIVRLVHVSTKEFITRPETEWTQVEDQAISCLRVGIAESQHLFCQISLRYLSVGDYINPFTSDEVSNTEKGGPLLEYASKNLIYHINESEPRPEYLISEIRRFAGSKQCLSWAENYTAHVFLGHTQNAVRDLYMFAASVDRSDLGEQFLEEFQKTVEVELVERSAKFGKDSWQVEHLKAILPMFHEESDNSVTTLDVEAQPVLPALSHTRIIEMAQMLMHNNSLPVPRQVNLLFGLSAHIQKLKILTDPLELLFRTILSKSAIIPAPVLLAIGNFYVRVEKEEKAMEVFTAAVAKTEPDTLWGCLTRIEIGKIMINRKQLAEAELWYRDLLLSLRTSFMDSDHTSNLIKFYLAKSLYEQDKYTEAEEYYRTVADNWESSGGIADPWSLNSKHLVGLCWYNQEEDTKAEPIFREIVNIYENHWKGSHTKASAGIAATQYWLARCLARQKKYSEAESLLHNVFSAWVEIYGENNLNTHHCAQQLGIVLSKQSKYAEAQEKLLFAIKSGEKVWGREDSNVLLSMSWLGINYYQENNLTQAIKYLRLTFNGYEQLQGTHHADFIAAAINLGTALYEKESYKEAEKLLQIEIEDWKRLKKAELDLRGSITLVETYYAQSKYAEAVELLKELLKGKRSLIGTDKEDIETFRYIHWLGYSLYQQKKYVEAEAELRISIDGYTRMAGVNLNDTVPVMVSLVNVLVELGHYVKAEKIILMEIEVRETKQGIDHQDTLSAVGSLAYVQTCMGKHYEAGESYRRLLERRRRAFGDEHEETLSTLRYLQGSLRRQGKFQDARELEAQRLTKYAVSVETGPSLETG